jgi:hypothetical protein
LKYKNEYLFKMYIRNKIVTFWQTTPLQGLSVVVVVAGVVVVVMDVWQALPINPTGQAQNPTPLTKTQAPPFYRKFIW